MKKLNKRSILECRWSTSPALVGYADTPEQGKRAVASFLATRPDFTGTPRQINQEINRIRENLGTTLSRFDVRLKTGEVFQLRELNELF